MLRLVLNVAGGIFDFDDSTGFRADVVDIGRNACGWLDDDVDVDSLGLADFG
jgi:hypothetical protein